MKNRILILSLLLALGISCYGQASFGIKGGLNFNDIVIKNAPFLPIRTYTPSLGFHFGVISKLELTKKIAFRPELLFVQRGANTSKNEAGEEVDVRINLNYLELPLLLSFTPARVISLDVGPNLALKISANGKTSHDKTNMNDAFNKLLDVGMSAGMTFHLSDNLSVISRYYYGLFSPNTFQGYSSTTGSPPTSSNRNLQIGFGYVLKKKPVG